MKRLSPVVARAILSDVTACTAPICVAGVLVIP